MVIDVEDLLRELDFGIDEGTSSESWVLRALDGTSFEVVPTVPVARLTAHSVRSYVVQRATAGRPLFVGKSATEGIAKRAHPGQIDVLTEKPTQLLTRTLSADAAVIEIAARYLRYMAWRPAWTRWNGI